MRHHVVRVWVASICLLGGGCLLVAEDAAPAAGEKIVLFDGKTLDGWTRGDGQPMTKGWVVEDGCIVRRERGGDLFTAKEYSDFIFELEWQVEPKSNSGIKYRFTSYGGMKNGPEYQILDDDGHPDAKLGDGKRKAGCLYDILAADTADVYRKPGEWNRTKIVARGSKVEHWLNDKLVLSYDSSTEEFKQAVAKSKFKGTPDYAGKLKGRIMLQDHNDPVRYRNITIIDLSKAE